MLGLEDVGLLGGSFVDGVVSGLIFGDSLVGEYVGIKPGHCCAWKMLAIELAAL